MAQYTFSGVEISMYSSLFIAIDWLVDHIICEAILGSLDRPGIVSIVL